VRERQCAAAMARRRSVHSRTHLNSAQIHG
jgi:hypothetical protein